jgi:hypothetical protein
MYCTFLVETTGMAVRYRCRYLSMISAALLETMPALDISILISFIQAHLFLKLPGVSIFTRHLQGIFAV